MSYSRKISTSTQKVEAIEKSKPPNDCWPFFVLGGWMGWIYKLWIHTLTWLWFNHSKHKKAQAKGKNGSISPQHRATNDCHRYGRWCQRGFLVPVESLGIVETIYGWVYEYKRPEKWRTEFEVTLRKKKIKEKQSNAKKTIEN